jgi:hypothetical protein
MLVLQQLNSGALNYIQEDEMGELYLDNFERSMTGQPAGRDSAGNGYRETRINKEYQPGRPIPLPRLPASAGDSDVWREALLSSASDA